MFQRLCLSSKHSAVVLVLGMVFTACTTPTLSPATPQRQLRPSYPPLTKMHTPTPTDILAITPTPVPTLTGEQKDRFLEAMLETNGGCELPCWWGGRIVPGKTTLGEAEWFFHSQGISHLVRSGVVDVVFQVPHSVAMQSWEYNTRIIITGQDGGLIQSIKVDGDTYSGEPTPRFARVWREHYAWDRVLTRLGMPSQVLVLMSPATYAGPADYSLTLVYASLGMLINYTGPAQEVDGSKIRACPRFDQVTRLTLRLVPPDMGDSLLGPRAQAFTLEETTGMSLKTFYETFSILDSVACLEQEIKP